MSDCDPIPSSAVNADGAWIAGATLLGVALFFAWLGAQLA